MAIRIPPRGKSADPARKQRLEQEAKTISSLKGIQRFRLSDSACVPPPHTSNATPIHSRANGFADAFDPLTNCYNLNVLNIDAAITMLLEG